MNERKKFLFDLQGFLKVENFLTAAEVAAPNKAIEANIDQRIDDPNTHASGKMAGERKRDFFSGLLTWGQPWCQPFRDLLAQVKVIPYLDGVGKWPIHPSFWLAARALRAYAYMAPPVSSLMAPNITPMPTGKCGVGDDRLCPKLWGTKCQGQ